MLETIRNWNQWLGKRMFIATLLAVIIGAFIRLPASPALRTIVIVLFAYMTFVTSLGISIKSFFSMLREPWVPLWPLFLVHIITPVIAWTVGTVFYPNDDYIRLGYLVCASIPIGVVSIMWTGVNKGNVVLALVAVMLDTLIVPFLLPLYFKLVAGQSLQLDYLGMMFELLVMVTLPSIVGMVLHDWTKGKVTVFAESIGGLSSKLGLTCVILINSSLVVPEVTWEWSIAKLLVATFLLVASGYLLGYGGSFIFRKRTYENVVALIYSVGLRNLSFGLVLALSYFPPAAALPITAGLLYQQPIAAAIPYLLKKVKRSS